MTTPIFGWFDHRMNYRTDLNHYILEQNLQQQRMSRGCVRVPTTFHVLTLQAEAALLSFRETLTFQPEIEG
ncbi:hypothetical protein D3C86_2188770 [compost metagenome]